ncbi:histidine phosphatase family protein [Candidatus Nomurabacteria bacterium]|nr:histidine phosphatase family protein [Candidatus Nomurabacteria bacterium]
MIEKENKDLCTLYIIRHGETEWNLKNIVQGHSDSELTEAGIIQVQEAAEELKEIHFDAVFSSDSPRTVRTAEIVRLDRELIIETSKLLRERNYGRFEGKPSFEFKEVLRKKLAERKEMSDEEHWDFRLADDIETDGELMTRFITQIREISVAYPGKTVLVVTHGGCIRNFLIRTGYFNRRDLPSGSFKNAGYVKVLSDGVDFFIQLVRGVETPGDSK